MTRVHRAAALVVLAAGLAACAEAPDESEDAGPLILPAILDLAPLEEVIRIHDVAPADGGGVWILNDGSPRLVLQDDTGALIHQFGAGGEGPDDFGFTPSIVAVSDSSVTVLDRGARGRGVAALRTFEPAGGAEIGAGPVPSLASDVQVTLGDEIYGEPFRATATDAGLVTSHYPRFRGDIGHLWNRVLVRVHTADGRTEELVDFRVEAEPFEERMAGARILVPAPLWAACSDGSTAVYLPFRDSVTWLRDVAGGFPAPRVPRPLTSGEVLAHVRAGVLRRANERGGSEAEIEAMLPRILEELEDEISGDAPAYVGMLCDPHGRLWLQRFSVEEDRLGRGREWEVLAPDGALAAVVRLPAGFRPLVFSGDTLLGAQRDSLNVERVAGLATAPVGEAR